MPFNTRPKSKVPAQFGTALGISQDGATHSITYGNLGAKEDMEEGPWRRKAYPDVTAATVGAQPKVHACCASLPLSHPHSLARKAEHGQPCAEIYGPSTGCMLPAASCPGVLADVLGEIISLQDCGCS